jgi:hypothetical protein
MDELRERFVSVMHLPGYYDYTGGPFPFYTLQLKT